MQTNASMEDEFLGTVTKGIVHGVYKVVTWFCFSVTQQHKVLGGIGHYTTKS